MKPLFPAVAASAWLLASGIAMAEPGARRRSEKAGRSQGRAHRQRRRRRAHRGAPLPPGRPSPSPSRASCAAFRLTRFCPAAADATPRSRAAPAASASGTSCPSEMAVYTEVGFAEADTLLQRLSLGTLTDLRGIRSGIENTNYYATTARGQWVITLFERLTREQLPYYLRLMQHLAERGIPVPAPQADAQWRPAAGTGRQAGGRGDTAARQPPPGARCTARRPGGRDAGPHAPGRGRPHRGTAAPARPGLVDRDRARRAALRQRRAGGAAERGTGVPAASWPSRPQALRCRAARSTPTCSATT